EEEDCFDKVAVGKEESAERFYMKDVNDYEVEMDSNIALPGSLTDVIKDPRANHKAAQLRIKEDYESAKKLGACNVPDHVLNPSRYTHYTFDSDEEVDEESNRKACMDFLNTLKGSAAMEIQE
ncbi:nonsense-mediated mRNA decay protein 2-like protein isoform X1, partial [Tanacetum coccineum]